MKLNNKHIAQDIINARKELEKKPETLEELVAEAASTYKEELAKRKTSPHKVIQQYTKMSPQEAEKCLQILCTTNKPEQDEEFLHEIPRMHLSWTTLKKVNSNKDLRDVYVLMMLAIFNGQIPFEVEKRILCLDNADDFILFLDKKGQHWSRKAKIIMHAQHPALHYKLFEQIPVYSTFMDR